MLFSPPTHVRLVRVSCNSRFRLVGLRRDIHARPSQMINAQAERMLNRPHENFRLARSRVGLSPTSPGLAGRTNRTSKQRRNLQLSNSSAEVLRHLQEAIDNDRVDASVYAAAIKRCGQGRWWDTLLTVWHLRKSAGVFLHAGLVSQYFTALANSARSTHRDCGVTSDRHAEALRLGKEAWADVPDSELNVVVVGSALSLCAAVTDSHGERSAAALQWSREICESATRVNIQLNVVHYSQLVRVLEEHGHADEVDHIIDQSETNGWTPNYVFLGGLLNVAAERRDLQRAGALWCKLVENMGVEPHGLAYAAYAKVHILCGQPAGSVKIFDHMIRRGFEFHWRYAQNYLQSLLIIYHSSMAKRDAEHIREVIHRVGPPVAKSSLEFKKQWQKMQDTLDQLESGNPLHLHDVLIIWIVRTKSVMVNWANYEAGSKYIDEQRLDILNFNPARIRPGPPPVIKVASDMQLHHTDALG